MRRGLFFAPVVEFGKQRKKNPFVYDTGREKMLIVEPESG